MTATPFQIAGRNVGGEAPCYVIAEAGVNHNGDLRLAKSLIDQAQRAGADAVKFQSFITEELVTTRAPKAAYQKETTALNESQLAMLKKLELSFAQQKELKQYADQLGITFLSTPFDAKSLDFLKALGVSAIKISSTDLTNVPFLQQAAALRLPILLSTGMSYLSEVREAVTALESSGAPAYALLHCTSLYPTPPESVHLRVLETFRREFQSIVGYSDHTAGVGAAPYAVACGAKIIEKHLTTDRHLPGPDHRASLTPPEFAQLVKTIREVEVYMGSAVKKPVLGELDTRQAAQKSIVATRALSRGAVLQKSDLSSKRPSGGLMPRWTDHLVGKRLLRDLQADDAIQASDIEGGETLISSERHSHDQ